LVSDIVLSAKIRLIRESGVDSLVKSIIRTGFSYASQLTVSGPHENGKYHLIDGAHRLSAIIKLSNSEEKSLKDKYSNYSLDCYVLPCLNHSQEMALAYSN
jgi:hypothetical protein